MTHPWVTENGQLQLSGLGAPGGGGGYGAIEVTAQEAQGAIDRASLVSMIRARLKEKTFRGSEYLFKQVGCALSVCGRCAGRDRPCAARFDGNPEDARPQWLTPSLRCPP